MERHRATTSTGAVVDDPSIGQLADLVAEVDRSGRRGFLFLQRRAPGVGETYLQAHREHDGWVLELCNGGPGSRYRTQVADAAHAYAGVASWLFRTRGWRALSWEHLSWEHQGGQPRVPGLAAAG